MGKLIAIEGTDCSGKETQSKLLKKYLEDKGEQVIVISFPMYDTPTGKIVGGDYLGKPEIGPCIFPEGAVMLDPKIACLYYAADRKYNMNKIVDFLGKGYTVILDRYTSSNMAHQGSKIENKEDRLEMYNWIDKLEYDLLSLPKPDITIFLHMPVEYSIKLRANRETIDEHEKDVKHLENSEKAYTELAGLYNWKTIECVRYRELRTIEEIHEDVIKALEN